ncbi:hypothetical protein [Candidatus Nitrosocosmicus arcticus]|uniref:Uncharacterized protein n=1 Tax=Candidatus Nitrosocosmicus arcticus TaxID=2035267 RepID=A0A557SYV2_9ARCH|nr:hypothetical protein [Candidatus Nitrosocosmicus arcticus]TVP41785.1 hypothetical protein NARC_10191 [Candidatus Nitrosocosmicus arcticus]
MKTSNFYAELQDRIIDFLYNNDSNEVIYVEKTDLVSEGFSSESDFFIEYLPKVLATVEKIVPLDIDLIKHRLRGKVVVSQGGYFHG